MTTTDHQPPDGFQVYQHRGFWYWQSRTVPNHWGATYTEAEAIRRAWEDKRAEQEA